MAASASRRPVRRPRTRSAPDAINQHGDRPQVKAQQPLNGGRYCDTDLPGQPGQRLSRPSHDPQSDEDAIVANLHGNRRPTQHSAPGRATASDASHAGDLHGGQTNELRDDASTHGQLRADQVAASVPRVAESDSAIRAGTPVLAVSAATAHANPIMRRLARPWVMITLPRTPSNGDPPARS